MSAGNEAEAGLTHAVDACDKVAAEVRAIGAAAKRVLDGPLTIDAAALLIRENLQRGFKSRIDVEDVKAVLYSAASLHVHLKKVK